MKKVLILTSGGDSSGMNAYIKSLAKLCKKNNINLVASLFGFQGLVENKIVDLHVENMNYIENTGGSIIKSSRSTDFMTKQGFETALSNLKKHNVDCVVVVGGNGTIKGAYDLSEAGVNVIAIPATIDNDMAFTEKTLGYDTACQNAAKLVNDIRQSMDCFERGLVVEVMGRDCADIALHTAIITGADVCVSEKIAVGNIASKIKNVLDDGKLSPVVIIKEHLFDAEQLAMELGSATNKTFRAVKIGYAQRGGEPSNADKMFAIELAAKTMECAMNSEFSVAIGQQSGNMIAAPIKEAANGKNFNSAKLIKLFDMYHGC